MTDQLREELHRIGDTAPVVDVAPDTWARARRARVRDQALIVVAVVAVVAVIALGGGLAGALPHRDDTPVAAAGDAAVPNHIWSVPERMAAQDNDEQWLRDEVETDLAVGTSAAAYVMDGGLPAVVDATDGGYHLLDLPGFNGRLRLVRTGFGGGTGLTLSPDGTHLAYAWSGPTPVSDAVPMPSGVRVVDLESGDIRTIPLQGGRGVVVNTIAWSPDSRWIAWSGQQTTYWTGASFGAREAVAGRIAPAATTSVDVPAARDAVTQYAVSDRGEVGIVTTNRVTRWNGEVVNRLDVGSGDSFTGSVVDADGTFPIAAFYRADDLLTVRVRDTAGYQVLVYTTTASRAYGDAELELRLGPGLDDRGVVPLGWVDGTHLLARTGGSTPPDQSRLPSQLSILGVGDDASYRVVGQVDPGVPRLTVATDLVDVDQPTVERPAPEWPWSDEHRGVVIALGAAGALLLVWLAVRFLRRTRWERGQARSAR